MGRKHHGKAPTHKRGRKGRRTTTPSYEGRVRVTGAGAFVVSPEGEFRLTRHALRSVMPDDRVSFSVERVRGGERRAFVAGIVSRGAKTVVGTYEEAGPLGVVKPLDTRIAQDFFVLPEDASAERLGVAPGDAVSARIVAYPSMHEAGVVTVERRLGDADAIDLGIQCIIARYSLSEEYPEAALEEAEELALDIDAALAEPLRRDLRDRFTFTVDPADARDYDDALSVERVPGGGFRLGVHIADVSHYVAWDSSVDLAARDRATSVYLADRVLPMLPERLCNDLCSLVPGEARLAMTVDMELSRSGEVRGYDIYPSVIRSDVRLSYDEAQDLLGEGGLREPVPGALEPAVGEGAGCAAAVSPECEKILRAALAAADELAELRLVRRHARGAIDFNTVEVRPVLDASGMPVALESRARTRATGLVEEAMLLANECVAEYLSGTDAPAAFRVHDAPSPESLAQAADVLLEVGAISREGAERICAGDRGAIQRAVEETQGTPCELLASAVLLRAMQRALYKPANEGHYALGAPAYCHFTSPIRRYPDLVVHRSLKRRLLRQTLGKKRARPYEASLVGSGDTGLEAVLPFVCRHSSERERAADAAAQASRKVKVAQYFSDRIGERFMGTVSWVDQMGVFVRLDDTLAEGLIRMRDLGGGEWWEYDHARLRMVGTSTGRMIALGQRVAVEVVSTSPLRGHVDFKLIRELRALH